MLLHVFGRDIEANVSNVTSAQRSSPVWELPDAWSRHLVQIWPVRSEHVNWPPEFANDDWRYGTQRAELEALCAYWRDEYDWRAQEARMNALPNYRTEIDGIPIHYLLEGSATAQQRLLYVHGTGCNARVWAAS